MIWYSLCRRLDRPKGHAEQVWKISPPPRFDAQIAQTIESRYTYWAMPANIRQDLLSYLLTYSMEQSPSWEAKRFSASQEIPRILWNPEVHYRIHIRPD